MIIKLKSEAAKTSRNGFTSANDRVIVQLAISYKHQCPLFLLKISKPISTLQKMNIH
jgi:hypothetical protein